MAEEQKYVPSENAVDISPDKDGGLYKEIIQAGTTEEKPSAGDNVKVHYVGTLLDGTEFDSSRSRGEKFSFMLGKGSVIKGWDVGVATMNKGEVAKLICRSDFAYGESGSPPTIPPNATLVFEVELFEWQCEDLSPNKDGGIQKKILQPGEGYLTPNDGATVNVHIVGKYNGSTFEERDVDFQIGEGSAHGIVEGLEIVLLKFKLKEKSLVMLKAPYAFKDAGKAEFSIPAGADIQYEVTLNSFEKEKESWELDGEEKLEQAKVFKEKGTNFFKAENYDLALKKYKKIADFLAEENSLAGEKQDEKNTLLLAGHLNSAACHLKLNAFVEAQKACDKALELDSNNVKGYFRRGQAYFGLRDYELARKDYLKVSQLDPTNRLAKNQAANCLNNIKKLHEKEKNTYKNMFEKFAEFDAKNAPKVEEIQPTENKTPAKEPWEEELENIEDVEPEKAS